MRDALTWDRQIVAALLAAGLAVFSARAQDAAPRVTTIPENPAENQAFDIALRGYFPSTDYAISGLEFKRTDVPPESSRGGHEFEITGTVRYRYGGIGGQALTPYDATFSAGRFPRFSRIKVSVTFVPEGSLAPSPWFRAGAYESYVYVRDPEPPRLSVDPPVPFSNQAVNVVMRWYHPGLFASRTRHEVMGSVVRIFQDVSYIGATAGGPVSEGVVTHEVGPLPIGEYTIEWRQNANGEGERSLGTATFIVAFAGGCVNCEPGSAPQPLDATSLAFDAYRLGTRSDPQTVTITPKLPPLPGFVAPRGALAIERIWTTNADYLVSHDCPLTPAMMDVGRSCALTVRFQGTMRGASPGRLYVRYVDFYGATRTTSLALSGRGLLGRGRNVVPPPVTPDTAVEYFSPALGHYFFTASPAEQQVIDAGQMGAWNRTGVAFPVGGPTDVCRFYGDPAAGPNSHFYTVSAAECAALRTTDTATPRGQRAWRYEGVALKAEAPAPYCNDESGRYPVYRLYNDGVDRAIDSNHRHVPSRGTFPSGRSGEDIAHEMIASGWIYEGNALCN